MQWKIKRPCEHCPFRRDVPPYLTAARARGLARTLSDDLHWFACHETTGIKNGKRVRAADRSHCAGAAIVLYRAGLINVATRLAVALNLISMDDLKAPVPVFNSLEQFVAHHSEGE